jgi:hypothetical protein
MASAVQPPETTTTNGSEFTAPKALRESEHWVLREGKKPVTRSGSGFITTPEGKKHGWGHSDFWFAYEHVIEAFEHRPPSSKIDGIGFIVSREPDLGHQQIIGIDIDCCRDPKTGEVSSWVESVLKKLDSPTSISISECGFRVFCLGKLPDGLNSLEGHGIDDLSDAARANILERKPNIQNKIDTGEQAYNCIELYEDGPRHLTITGKWLPEYPAECETRTKELADIIHSFIQGKTTKKRTVKSRKANTSQKATLPSLSITDVIDTRGFVEEGDQLFGPHPTLGSATGRNLVVNPSKNVYCYMHNGINAGGDSWIWLACECGAIPWERAGPRALIDADAIQQVKQHAMDRGLFTENELFPERKAEISEEDLRAYSLPTGPKFECRLPDDHFIQRFMAYGADVSDAYPDYWFAGGIFSLAVVADKKLKIVLKQGTYYPNLYIMILGKSSLSRKSTAADKMEAMLCQVLSQLLFSLVPTEFSPEAFIEHMDEHNHAPWIRDEAAGVLSLMKKDYMRGFKDSLMQLYDCKPFYRKLRTSQRKSKKTDFRVADPYLNLFFATTDASLGANTEQNDTLSGFLARFLFFFPQGRKPRWMPLEEGDAQNSILEMKVRSQLALIVAKVGKLQECTAMHLSPEAKKFYDEWQRVREDEWTASNDGFCMQIHSRLAPTVVKLGMLFELGSSDFDPARPVRLEFIQEACRLVDAYFMPTARAVYDLVGVNAEKNVIDRITAYLKNHGGKATKREIMATIKIKSADFSEYLATMEESGIVETKIVKRGGKGRDTLYVFLLSSQKTDISSTNVSNVSNVSIVSIVSNVSNVEEIPPEGA